MKQNDFTFYILHIVLHSWFIRHWRTSAEPGNPPKCELNPYMPNKPNFQPTMQTITPIMTGTYNDDQPKKRKKNKPKTHQK